MGSDRLFSPVVSVLSIQEQYHREVSAKLQAFGLEARESNAITTDIFAKDTIYFSINRPYERIPETFSVFCKTHRLHTSLPVMFPTLDRHGQFLYRHQAQAIERIQAGKTTIISTGTGSGKTESFLIPILHYCLVQKGLQQSGIKAVILYPLNALANDQIRRIVSAIKGTGLKVGCFVGSTPKTMQRKPGDPLERCLSRQEMIDQPPDILITNYIMLDRLLTKPSTRTMFLASRESIKYLVVDEIHYFRGTKGANLSMLLRRFRSLCRNQIVQIGASGTLRHGGGYFPDQARTQIADFTRLIFGQEALAEDGIQPIEPLFLQEEPTSLLEMLPPTEHVSGSTLLDTLDKARATALSEQLFGSVMVQHYQQRYRNETGIKAFPGYYLILQSPFVHALRALLTKKISTFQEIVDLFCGLYRTMYGHDPIDPKSVVETYWSLIDYLNEGCVSAGLSVLLDYRIHLILNDVSENLTRCLQCGHYHDGRCIRCRHCNNGLLFNVSKSHPDQCIAYLAKDELFTSRVTGKQVFPVLVSIDISTNNAEGNPVFLLEDSPDLLDIEGYHLQPAFEDSQRGVSITLIQDKNLDLATLPISETHVYWHNVLKIIDGLVTQQKTKISDKILGFIDNREKASGLKLRLNDDFADRTLTAWATNILKDNALNLLEAFTLLRNNLPSLSDSADTLEERERVHVELLYEMPFWFSRVLTYLPDETLYSDWQISIDKNLALSAEELEILETILLPAHALDLTPFKVNNIAHLKHFYLDKYRVETQYGVGSRSCTERNYRVISLSDQGVRYQESIQRIGPEKIFTILQNLLGRGIIQQKSTPTGCTYYQLCPQHVILEVSIMQEPEDEWQQKFVPVECHTADHSEERRADIERRFSETLIKALICTPTLEMGVDIGSLSSVLMLGFPPSPANYAQRAGRAGRGGKRHHATIVVLSSSDDAHDAYYYDLPTKMIDGAITPPQFTLHNFSLLAAHSYAHVLAGTPDSLLRSRFSNISKIIQQFIDADELHLLNTLGEETYTRFAHYLLDDSSSVLARFAEQHILDISLEACYRSGLFPDYGFRNDGLPLLDKSLKASPREDHDQFLTAREPEGAPGKLAPGRIVFCGGKAVCIQEEQPSDSYQLMKDPAGRDFRLPRYIVANTDESTQIEKWRDPQKTYRISRLMLLKLPLEELPRKGPLYCQVYLVPECTLYFINEGEIEADGQQLQPLKDKRGSYRFGMTLERAGLLVRFTNLILSSSMKANFLAVLLRSIPDYCNLDDTELRVIQNVNISSFGQQDERYANFFLYGQDKSGQVPFERIFTDLNTLLNQALAQLRTCSCHDSGCYLCLFSLNSHMLTGRLLHAHAVEFLAAFLQEERLKPNLPLKQSLPDRVDIIIHITSQGSNWRFLLKDTRTGSTEEHIVPYAGDQNSTLYQELQKLLKQSWLRGARSIQFCSNQEYVRHQLSGEYAINKGTLAFFSLWLERMRWQSWHVTEREVSYG